MRVEQVKIYSDATNQAILRHPGRKFPGVLIQGDTLHNLYLEVDSILSKHGKGLSQDGREELKDVRKHLKDLIEHYKAVLREHGMELPFSDR